LDVSRIQAGRFPLSIDEVDLSLLTKNVLERFDDQLKSVNCQIDVSADTPIVGRWDRQRLEQVVVNLLSNAMKYAPGKPVSISVTKRERTAVLEVQDNGPGISRDLQTKIFDRFERAKASKNIGGLGLGLFIVKSITEAHKGRIHVESEPGRGAKFIVELPLDREGDGAS